MKKTKNLLGLLFVLLIWIIRPVPYHELGHHHPKNQIITLNSNKQQFLTTSSNRVKETSELEFLEGSGQGQLTKGFSPSTSYPGRPGSRIDLSGARNSPGSAPSPGASKPPRLPSGFYRIQPRIVGGRLYGGPAGGPGGDDDDPNKNFNLEDTDKLQKPEQCKDLSIYQPEKNDKLKKKKKKPKNSVEFEIVNGQLILRITRDDMPFYIDELTARKKIYHAPDFGVALPDTLDLKEIQSLSTKDRLEYLSDPNILPKECVFEYMKKLGQHLLDSTTEIKVGTLGKNGPTKGWDWWDEPIPGTHAFNPVTGNNVFFADDGFKFHTGMHLNDGQLIDLEDNNNIL